MSMPTSRCSASACRTAASSTARNCSAVTRPARCSSRACNSSGGRSKLPTWSARYGEAMLFASYHSPPQKRGKQALKRREFIERTGLAVGALGLPMLLQACAPAAPAPSGAGASAPQGAAKATSVMPTYIPFPNKPKPDYPSQGDPYMDGYDNFPRDPVKALSGEVG